VIFGEHPETKQLFVDHSVDVLAAYCNAVRGQDGWGSMPASFGNLIRATAEVNESIFPVRHECCDYEIDTGGAGEFRGCPCRTRRTAASRREPRGAGSRDARRPSSRRRPRGAAAGGTRGG
jgi:N-methylhydantoinase B/oxoprolinase/acetone carboxylase alpha subunit